MQMTSQQRQIIDTSLRHQDLSVNAGPGCGKTATLSMIAQAKQGQSIVNFCFNRSTKQQADEKMPSWVKNYTFHGAAYGYCGKYYAPKLKIKLSPKVIAARFGCDEHVATVAKYTLRRFASSDDGCILGHHVPRESVIAKDKTEQDGFRESVVMTARKTWLAAMDHKDREIGVEHDFYLKRWVEEGAKLAGKYDTVLIDEGQDMVPVNLKAMHRLHGQKIVVGDRNQQLYQWRGALDSLSELNFDQQLHLTNSFRFGPEIAEVANQVLDLFPEQQPHLIGVGKPSRIEYGPPEGRYAVLCRSNAGLLGETLAAIRKGQRIHVIGSLIDSILLIESAWYLSIGEDTKVKHPTMKLIGTWEAVLEMAKEDADLAMAVKRVEEYGSSIPFICEELRNAGETSRERADVILSTIHKAKGDEFPAVKLGEDFPDLVRWVKKERRYKPMKAELCVFFVAVTRAQHVLYANSTISQLKTWKELL